MATNAREDGQQLSNADVKKARTKRGGREGWRVGEGRTKTQRRQAEKMEKAVLFRSLTEKPPLGIPQSL